MSQWLAALSSNEIEDVTDFICNEEEMAIARFRKLNRMLLKVLAALTDLSSTANIKQCNSKYLKKEYLQ